MSRRRRPKHPAFKQGRTIGQERAWGEGKHRKARIQRFKGKHPKSDKVPCGGCGHARSRCTCTPPQEA